MQHITMPNVRLVIKPTAGGEKITLEEVDTEGTVGELKAKLAPSCGLAVSEQRVIYKGQILKDERTVGSYGGWGMGHHGWGEHADAIHAAMQVRPGIPRSQLRRQSAGPTVWLHLHTICTCHCTSGVVACLPPGCRDCGPDYVPGLALAHCMQASRAITCCIWCAAGLREPHQGEGEGTGFSFHCIVLQGWQSTVQCRGRQCALWISPSPPHARSCTNTPCTNSHPLLACMAIQPAVHHRLCLAVAQPARRRQRVLEWALLQAGQPATPCW